MAEKIAVRADDALLAVDMQNDFMRGGALAVPGGETIMPLVNRLIGAFAQVVLTQDWHPPGHASFASSHPGAKPFERIAMPYGEQVLWPDHCVQGSTGAAFVDGLDVESPLPDSAQGHPRCGRFLFRLPRSRSPDDDRARCAAASARNRPGLHLRPRH